MASVLTEIDYNFEKIVRIVQAAINSLSVFIAIFLFSRDDFTPSTNSCLKALNVDCFLLFIGITNFLSFDEMPGIVA